MKKPNIIVIMTDDQGCWALGCAGNREIITPNIDRLAEQGMRFDNFFCASPVCSPARASLLTGMIPSQHGVHDWIMLGNWNGIYAGKQDHPVEYLKGLTAYTDVLAKNGYTCGISGKWHLGDSARPQKSFSHWFTHVGGGGHYYNATLIRDGKPYTEPEYVTYAFTDDAINFIEDAAIQENPFYLSVHYTAPHSPWLGKEHPQELLELYRDCPFESCPEEPMHPWQIGTSERGRGEKRRALLAGYYAAITAVDQGVGKIVRKLEELGIREKTLIFYTSDNGMNMGHHGIFGKGNGTYPQNMFDTSVKVPAIISRPGHVPQGKVCGSLLSHYDFMPTILEYAGIDYNEPELPGQSFANILRGEEPEDREMGIVVCDEYGPTRMIRTGKWKYVHRFQIGPNELYKLEADPGETRNLADDPRYAEMVSVFRTRLHDWFARHAYPSLDGSTLPVKGVGQTDLAIKGATSFQSELFYVNEDGDPIGGPPEIRSREKNLSP
jgi:arylsulfatase A-like enzyme